MTDREQIKQALAAGVLSGEALAFLWSLDFCRARRRLPTIREIRDGVAGEYGEALTRPTAGRGLYKARRQLARQAPPP